MIQPVDKELNGSIETEKAAEESDRISEFKKRAERDFFATISAYVSDSLFDKSKDWDKAYQRYNIMATHSLESDLKVLGLNITRTTGVWEGSVEKSFLVWNTAYSWDRFQAIILRLAEDYKQKAVCIGRKVGEGLYDIDLWETDSLDDISYHTTDHFTRVSIEDAIQAYSSTVLTRKVYDPTGKLSEKKVKRAITFEEIEVNQGLASFESTLGGLKRNVLYKQLLSGEFNKDGRASFEQIKRTVFTE